jgi:hypothetical protein
MQNTTPANNPAPVGTLAEGPSGALALDVSPVWTGRHVFTQPVAFPSKQTFQATQIVASGQASGSLLVSGAAGWQALPVGPQGQVLTSVGGAPIWGRIDLASGVAGVMPVANGGTGVASPLAGGLVVGASGVWAQLPPGAEGSVLSVRSGTPAWVSSSALSGSGAVGHIAAWGTAGVLGQSSLSIKSVFASGDACVIAAKRPRLLLSDGLRGGMSLEHDGATLVVGVNDPWLGGHDEGFEGAAIRLDTRDEYGTQFFRLNRTDRDEAEVTVWSVGRDGALTCGSVPSSRITGAVPVSQGGTGVSVYSRGDILCASSSNTLSRVSAIEAEGLYLKVVNGYPTWATGASGAANGAVRLPAGTSSAAPLMFLPGVLTATPVDGSLEWAGGQPLFTSGGVRRPVAFSDGDITGSAGSVSGVVGLANGGTGSDLSAARVGGLLCVQADGKPGWLTPGGAGLILTSRGPDACPSWEVGLRGVTAATGGGLIVDSSDPARPSVEVDRSVPFRWAADHSFPDVSVEGELSLASSAVFAPSQPAAAQTGEMWWDGTHLRFRTAANTVAITDSSPQPLSHCLRLGEEISPSAGSTRRARFPLPYAADGVSSVAWRLRRLDFRSEVAPTSSDAQTNILVDGVRALSSPLRIPVGQQSASATDFAMFSANSGQLVQVEFVDDGGGDAWSYSLQIEQIP